MATEEEVTGPTDREEQSFGLTKWFLPEELDKQYTVIGSARENGIPQSVDISRINILVGPNNSGKSRFLRGNFATNSDKIRISQVSLDSINQIYSQISQDVRKGITRANLHRIGDIDVDFRIAPLNYLQTNQDFLETQESQIKAIRTANIHDAIHENKRSSPSSDHAKRVLDNIHEVVHEIHPEISGCLPSKDRRLEFQKIYIPVLRGLRPLLSERQIFPESDPDEVVEKERRQDRYLLRTVADYFWSDEASKKPRKPSLVQMCLSRLHEIFTGLSLYEEVKKSLLGDKESRESIRVFENFLSETFFENLDVTLTPRWEKDVLTVTLENEKEQEIYNLGDGIQQIIIQTFPLFLKRDSPVMLFVEEPELYLHPGLQRILLETWLDFPNLTVFLTTHSNHLLEIALERPEDVSILKFNKNSSQTLGENPTFSIQNTKSGDLSVLDSLGVRNASVFLANCTIWVEGVTDRMYIRKLLEIFQKEKHENGEQVFEEDRHFAFVQYGGSNLENWSFSEEPNGDEQSARAVCNRIFVVADRDKGKQKKHDSLNALLQEDYYVLKGREIENLLPPDVLQSVIKHYEGDNPKIVKEPVYRDYRLKSLGTFIENIVLGDRSKRPRLDKSKKVGKNYHPYSKSFTLDGDVRRESTLKDKGRFAEIAISQMGPDTKLTTGAEDLCEKIYEFIKKHNPGV